jgi:hypothetical protein
MGQAPVYETSRLEIGGGKRFERLHKARQWRLHNAGADLPYPGLAVGNARVDPGEDFCLYDLPYINPGWHTETIKHW